MNKLMVLFMKYLKNMMKSLLIKNYNKCLMKSNSTENYTLTMKKDLIIFKKINKLQML